MSWKPIDFHGIISLNQTVVEQLYQYLEEKESQTCRSLMTALHPLQGAPILEPSPTAPYKLSEAIEQLSKKIHHLIQNHSPISDSEDWKQAARSINQRFWEYLEILQESVIELFQQVDQVGIEEWREDLSHAIEAIKEILSHRLEELKWGVARTEIFLRNYCLACEAHESKRAFLRKASFLWKPILDKGLQENIDKSQKFLDLSYSNFAKRYHRFREISGKMDGFVQKFSWYKTFGHLEAETQNKLKKLFRLTKLWEMNAKSKAFPPSDIAQAIYSVTSPEKALEYFREYDRLLYKTLFINSRAIKENVNEFADAEGLMKIQEAILSYRAELETLGGMIEKYRDFLAQNSPSKTFLEWSKFIRGDSKAAALLKELKALKEEVLKLDNIYESFRHAVERKTAVPDASIGDVDGAVQYVLHEMSQPLMSSSMMKVKGERVINLLQQLDELTTSRKEVVEYIGYCLSKAMRMDWKYQVLFDIPDFHQVYGIHQGILGPSEDRNHLNRMQKFKRYLYQMGQWIKNGDASKRAQEIELDMNDIKGYLQDFFANVQRLVKDDLAEREAKKRWLHEISQQLLEYRYLFGAFFHQLQPGILEERIIRNQFLFVDQYFEAVDSKLHEWEVSLRDV